MRDDDLHQGFSGLRPGSTLESPGEALKNAQRYRAHTRSMKEDCGVGEGSVVFKAPQHMPPGLRTTAYTMPVSNDYDVH